MNGHPAKKAPPTAAAQFPGLLSQVVNDGLADGLRTEFIIGVLHVMATELAIKTLGQVQAQQVAAQPQIILPNAEGGFGG